MKNNKVFIIIIKFFNRHHRVLKFIFFIVKYCKNTGKLNIFKNNLLNYLNSFMLKIMLVKIKERVEITAFPPFMRKGSNNRNYF